MKPNYTPAPFETEEIKLPDEIIPLVEHLARNVHEVWADGRMKDGWVWGEVRDDLNRKHPCLVPYDELPESEKEYDRHTAVETLKLIVHMGFKISREQLGIL